MRPTGLGQGFYNDVPDYSIFCDEWCIGRIHETLTGPEELRWLWATTPRKPGSLRTSNQATPDQAKAEFDRAASV